MGLRVDVIERQFALMNRTGPLVKGAVQQIKYECIRYANELAKGAGTEEFTKIQRAAIAEARTSLKNSLAVIQARRAGDHDESSRV